MNFDKSKFEKYSKLNIDNMEQFESLNFINEYIEQLIKDTDNMYCEFLEDNGYKIDKPYNIEQLNQIKNDLAEQDKFLDCFEYTEFSKDSSTAYHYIIPFFNRISNPLTEEEKQDIINRWKRWKKRDNG